MLMFLHASPHCVLCIRYQSLSRCVEVPCEVAVPSPLKYLKMIKTWVYWAEFPPTLHITLDSTIGMPRHVTPWFTLVLTWRVQWTREKIYNWILVEDSKCRVALLPFSGDTKCLDPPCSNSSLCRRTEILLACSPQYHMSYAFSEGTRVLEFITICPKESNFGQKQFGWNEMIFKQKLCDMQCWKPSGIALIMDIS